MSKTKVMLGVCVGILLMCSIIIIFSSDGENTTNTGKTKIISVELDDGTAYIKINVDDNFNFRYIKMGIIQDAQNIFITTFENTNYNTINRVEIDAYNTLVNGYGQESEGVVMQLSMTRQTYNKINWDNMYTDSIVKVLDYYWQHSDFN